MFERYPLGLVVILAVAVASAVYVGMRPSKDTDELVFWTFNKDHQDIFREIYGPDGGVDVQLLGMQSFERRMLSGFFTGTPVADIIMVERSVASQAWRGPTEAIGFLDLTDRLEAEGLLDRINKPSQRPWTVDGRIYGLPFDVHPVMLAYRADLYEAAGIDITQAETWDEFMEMSRPLIGDLTGNGSQDRFALEVSETDGFSMIMLIQQAGGDVFDENDQPTVNSELNVDVLTRTAQWFSGNEPFAVDVPLFSGAGERLRGEGFVLAWMCPDWRARRNILYIEGLHGKVKLMPLPAWERGGRRTSVWGGTMLGLPRNGERTEEAWGKILDLYTSRELGRTKWERLYILSPFKDFWDDPVFDQPDPYYRDQPVGRMFQELADSVPERTPSVYFPFAAQQMADALHRTVRRLRQTGVTEYADIEPIARRELDRAQANIENLMSRNVFQ